MDAAMPLYAPHVYSDPMLIASLEALLGELPAHVDACGENGEFHTCVSAGPMFDAPLTLVQGDTELREGRFAFTDYGLAAAT